MRFRIIHALIIALALCAACCAQNVYVNNCYGTPEPDTVATTGDHIAWDEAGIQHTVTIGPSRVVILPLSIAFTGTSASSSFGFAGCKITVTTQNPITWPHALNYYVGVLSHLNPQPGAATVNYPGSFSIDLREVPGVTGWIRADVQISYWSRSGRVWTSPTSFTVTVDNAAFCPAFGVNGILCWKKCPADWVFAPNTFCPDN